MIKVNLCICALHLYMVAELVPFWPLYRCPLCLLKTYLVECGFERGLTCAVVYSAEKDVSGVVHGDDFTFEGGGP